MGNNGVSISSKDLVFANAKGHPLRYNAIVSAYNAGFKALDLPWTTTHICRHTQGTKKGMVLGSKLSHAQDTPKSTPRF